MYCNQCQEAKSPACQAGGVLTCSSDVTCSIAVADCCQELGIAACKRTASLTT